MILVVLSHRGDLTMNVTIINWSFRPDIAIVGLSFIIRDGGKR